MEFLNKRLRWVATGVLVEWLFDPDLGKDRRTRIHAAALTTRHRVQRLIDASRAELPTPIARRLDRFSSTVVSLGRNNDRVLAERVRREVLDGADARLVVEVHRGRVAVAGTLTGSFAGLEARIRRIPGVVGVDLLAQASSDRS